MKIKKVLRQGVAQLKEHSPTSSLDSEILLGKILHKNREFIFSNLDLEITQKDFIEYQKLIERRINKEPVAYILQKKDFFGRTFEVSINTLIPRPETEILLEKTLDHFNNNLKNQSTENFFIDIGTGSGCILVSLAKELETNQTPLSPFSKNSFIGIDISPKALEIAKKNWSNFFKENSKNAFCEGSLLSPLIDNSLEQFENKNLIITANLPYLSEEIYQDCPISVSRFEPKIALIAKKEGLDFYLKLLNQIKEFELDKLANQIYLILEISPEQKKLAEKEFTKIFPTIKMNFNKDLASKWRFVEIIF